MHKKIIAALGMAGFIMLSYVKVNYAMDYDAAEAIADVAVQYAEETAEAGIIQKDSAVVMASLEETGMEGDTEENVTEQQTEPEVLTEPETEQTTEGQTENRQPSDASQNNTTYLENLVLSEYNEAQAVSGRVINISQKDYEILLRIVEAEATGQDVLAKMLVANVIFNRIDSPSFPDTLEAVVFQKNDTRSQFSPIDDGRYYTVTISDSTIEAVNRVLAGEDYSMGALYFATVKLVDSTGCWASRHCEELYRYGGHVFFRQ